MGLHHRRASTTRTKKGVDKTQFFFHYDYMNETLRAAKVGFADIIGWYVFKVEDPATADQLAKRVDAMFENSSAETKTATEKAFTAEWAKQVGDIGSIMIAITAVVMGFILFVAGNAMAQSIRERTNELGVLKTLGFQDGKILAIVLLESCAIAVIGGGHRPGARLADHRAGRSDRRDAADLPFPAARPGVRRRAGRRARPGDRPDPGGAGGPAEDRRRAEADGVHGQCQSAQLRTSHVHGHVARGTCEHVARAVRGSQ